MCSQDSAQCEFFLFTFPSFFLFFFFWLKQNSFIDSVGFPGGSVVKNLPAVQENWVQFLGWEDPLGKGMVTHSSILAWIIPWTEEPGGLQSIRSDQSFSRVRLFATPWITARQTSLSITNSQSSLKLMSIEFGDAIQPSHPLSSPSPPAPNPSQHQGPFQ